MKIGYACINLTLAQDKIQVNRSMVKKTFASRGCGYASGLALKNVIDLKKVVDWNISNGLLLYRMSSDMFPWMSEYQIADLPDYPQIKQILFQIGEKAMAHDLRLTFHPGPFNVLATHNERVAANTIRELEQHGQIMDLLGLPRSPYAKINIHVGGAYGDRSAAIKRFVNNFGLLPASVSSRLTIENDDKATMFSVGDLLEVHEATGIPIVFDYHHHQFRTGDLTTKEAQMLALSTWPKNIRPVVHYSSSRKRFEDTTAHDTSHADFIYEQLNVYQQEVDVMVEAKAKEKATMKFIDEFLLKDLSYSFVTDNASRQ
jgi:UV DNA damage endonuclease